MYRKLFLLPVAAIGLFLIGCSSEPKEDPKLKEEIIQLETTTVELDSTLHTLEVKEQELDAALEELDLGE